MYLGCFSIVTFFLPEVLRREGSDSGSKEPKSNVNFGIRLLLRCDFDDFRASGDALRLDFRDFFCRSRDDEVLRYPLFFDDFDDFRASGDALRLDFRRSRDVEVLRYLFFDNFDDFRASGDALRLDFRRSRDDEVLRYLFFDDFDDFRASGDALRLDFRRSRDVEVLRYLFF